MLPTFIPSSIYLKHNFRPQVHYVPLSYSSSDLIEKIEWLIEHDTMAQRIAENAKNFGTLMICVYNCRYRCTIIILIDSPSTNITFSTYFFLHCSGKSYLRLEDYYCYVGAALTLTAEIMRDTDATADFPIEQM